MTILKIGTGVVPAPAMIDAAALAQLPPADAELEREKWEGVLVRVVNVPALADPGRSTRPATSWRS